MSSEWRDKTALITGASVGIGATFARRLAAAGAHLILTARSQAALETLAAELRQRHGVRVAVVVADLALPEAPRALADAVAQLGWTVDLLVNNAGFGAVGEFQTLPLERQIAMIQVNDTALVALTYHFLPAMLARKSGAVINLASTAAFQGVPYFAVYAATKSFILTFSEALWGECREHGVRVLALCPGSTVSNFHEVAGTARRHGLGRMQSAEAVVDTGLRALAQGRAHVVSGWRNWLMVQGERFVPRQWAVQAAQRLFRQFITP